MKKIFSIFLIQFFILGFVFGAKINSKQGYEKLQWGSTLGDTKRAGYKLTIRDTPANLYSEYVEVYNVTSKDKNIRALQFHFYNRKLFFVSESISDTDFSQKALESRYGNFSKQGIYLAGRQYTDAARENDGSVSSLSIIIQNNSSGKIIAQMYDWSVYSKISFAGQKLSKSSNSKSRKMSATALQFEEAAEEIVNTIVQEKGSAKKPSLAFSALATDYRNTLVDNYVTDALTEAMLYTRKIKIIERANLEVILSEQKFQSSGLVNQKTAKDIGMIAGVDFVCFGELKDIGNSIYTIIRVVDVETGEICAICSPKITKDEYLKNQPRSAVGVPKPAEKTPESKTPTPETKTPVAKADSGETKSPPKTTSLPNAWKVTKFRDDFENDHTDYVFRVFSSDFRFVFIYYKKCDIAANSRVITGVHWQPEDDWDFNKRGTYDIKSKEGTVSMNYNDCWNFSTDNGKLKFDFVWNQKAGSRLLTERFKNNETVSLRRDNLVRRFQTAGLLDKMAEYGITWKEIDAALANEEF